MNTATLTMTCTDAMAKELEECLNIAVEMLQGTREKLADGRTQYILKIEDEGKIALIKQFMVGVMYRNINSKEHQN